MLERAFGVTIGNGGHVLIACGLTMIMTIYAAAKEAAIQAEMPAVRTLIRDIDEFGYFRDPATARLANDVCADILEVGGVATDRDLT